MRKRISITVAILPAIILLYIVVGFLLSYEKQVQSPYVLLEGWLSHYHMEFAANHIMENNYDSVFIVGMINQDHDKSLQQVKKTKKLKGSDNSYSFYTNGILGFEVPVEKLKDNSILTISMRGTKALDNFPHFQVFENEKFIGSGFVNENNTTYKFNVSKNKSDTTTLLSINFDNHLGSSFGDRHLIISDISIDTVNIDSISVGNFFIDNYPNMHFEFITGLNRIKYYLADRGYDSSKIKLVELEPASFNKSMAIAQSSKEYFEQANITRINIITVQNHSRRSYLNFKNSINDVAFGCITIPNSLLYENSLYYKIDARITLLYTWLYWWFN